jgi:DNA-binding transcriptional ArsR family regulator
MGNVRVRDWDKLAIQCRALSNTTRIQILVYLYDNHKAGVCELAEALERIPSIMAGNVRRLENAGLITRERDGNVNYCYLTDIALVKRIIDLTGKEL